VLKDLHLQGVGPASRLDVDFGERLNLFTGDNGLGKTFLLDIAWWALTGTWTSAPALPQPASDREPRISAQSSSVPGGPVRIQVSGLEYDFDRRSQRWHPEGPTEWGLVVYARVDGGFSVWDPARSRRHRGTSQTVENSAAVAYHFQGTDLWDGLGAGGKVVCNGLIRDWVSWQNQPDQDASSPFALLSQVLLTLSPDPSELIRPGKPTRVSLDDVRDIPTVELPYGNVPVTLVSAGMRRVLGLAYLLVWVWYEHLQASRLVGEPPTQDLVLLMDEVEAHLHPRWQRTLLPAALRVATGLQGEMKTQVLATTHSPLVLASVEPVFDPQTDRCSVFDVDHGDVLLRPLPWAKQGDTVGWLTSEAFGLRQARSREAEEAIEAAEALMRDDGQALPPHLRTREQIQAALERLVPGHDPFWPRWVVTTGQP
jgi:hypothetical protein